jgi:hypothetical protein
LSSLVLAMVDQPPPPTLTPSELVLLSPCLMSHLKTEDRHKATE